MVSNNKENDFLFPIIIKDFSKETIERYFKIKFSYDEWKKGKDKRIGIEGIVFTYYEEKGYDYIGEENQPIYDLFFHLGFEKFLLKPNWKKWDKNKTIKEYPHLIQHLDYPFESGREETKCIKSYKEWVLKYFSNVPLEWMFSNECIYYQMFKEEIDDYLENQLSIKDIPTLMKKNYEKVKVMREKYPTLFIWGGTKNTEHLEIIFQNLPLKLVQYILKKQFENFHRYRSGFMDCWMLNERKQHLKLVEGKRIYEEIKPNQIYWLNKFFEYGVDVSIMRVNFIK